MGMNINLAAWYRVITNTEYGSKPTTCFPAHSAWYDCDRYSSSKVPFANAVVSVLKFSGSPVSSCSTLKLQKNWVGKWSSTTSAKVGIGRHINRLARNFRGIQFLGRTICKDLAI